MAVVRRPPRELVTPRRFDIAVKYRFFRNLLCGGDQDSEQVFRWHIEKRSGHRMQAGLATDVWKLVTEDYVQAAQALFASMVQSGFDARYPIPLSADGELLNGSHRLACALALDLTEVPVAPSAYTTWAPAWGEQWFKDNGCLPADLDRIRQDMKDLTHGWIRPHDPLRRLQEEAEGQ